jgi:hypothetical protein
MSNETITISNNKVSKTPSFGNIPVHLIRRPSWSSPGIPWYTKIPPRIQEDSQYLRSIPQYSFFFVCTWIVVDFYLFIMRDTFYSGRVDDHERLALLPDRAITSKGHIDETA